MTQSLQLEGHKLQYHPDRVADFLAGRTVWPIYAEISPTSACNHRCRFCNFNCLGHEGGYFPRDRLPVLMDELKRSGVKAVVFAGAGEPSLHPDTFPAIRRAREAGLDVAMSTNGAVLRDRQLQEMAECLTWVRFSINGGTPGTYAACQGTGTGDFEQVMANLERLSEYKARLGSKITIGTQCVLIPENRETMEALAGRLKNAGADYFSIKHFYTHSGNPYQPDMSFLTPEFLDRLRDETAQFHGDAFNVIVRNIDRLDRFRPYEECLGLPFLVYIRENGLLYTCFSHQEDRETALGSLLEKSFAALWQSAAQDAVVNHINRHYDKKLCQANCRHHETNLWLHQLTSPPAHVNFI
jgi:MoaA/NifB/PqqE/SkfB family radical SAM enzyme